MALYRQNFQPSEQLAEPYVMAGANVFAADDADVAHRQMTKAYRARTRAMLTRGARGANFTDAEIDAFLASPGGASLAAMTRYTAVGTPGQVRDYLTGFAKEAEADELILAHHAAELDDRVRSIELTGAALNDS